MIRCKSLDKNTQQQSRDCAIAAKLWHSLFLPRASTRRRVEGTIEVIPLSPAGIPLSRFVTVPLIHGGTCRVSHGTIRRNTPPDKSRGMQFFFKCTVIAYQCERECVSLYQAILCVGIKLQSL